MNHPAEPMTELHEPRARATAVVRSPISRWVWPGLILLLALALRILHLGHESVSGDEAFSITLTRDPLGVMMHRLVLDLVHPPLHYLALRGWLKLFGFGLLQARLLSVIFGTLAVVFLYLLAEYLFDRRTAMLAGLLMAVSQLAIMFSQEARPYAQMHWLAPASAYLFLRACHEQRAAYWWAFVAAGVVMLYTDYFGLYLIAALLLVAVIYRDHYRLCVGWALGGAAAMVILYLPWLSSGIVGRALQPGNVARQTADYAAVHWWTLVSIVNSFNNGKPAGLRSDSPWWTLAVGGLLFSAPLLLLLRKLAPAADDGTGQRDREGIVIAAVLCLVPIFLTLLSGKVFHVPYNVRYVSFCAAFYYILVGRAIFEVPLGVLRWGLVSLILLYSANALRANYFLRWKEHWDAAFAYVASHRQPQDCGVFPPNLPQQRQPWEVTQAEGPPLFQLVSYDSLASGFSGCERLWEIAAAPRDDWREWNDYKKNRDQIPASYKKIDQQRFYAVQVTLYSRQGQ
jgi:4-amino-4-deoxy-L-arabinose transferase-like glycosyltransferase